MLTLKSILSGIQVQFLFLTTWSLLLKNSSGPYVADNVTYLLTFQDNLRTLTHNSKLQVGPRDLKPILPAYSLPDTGQRTQTSRCIIETQKNMAQNFFTNKYKAILQRVDFKAKLKIYVPENCPWGLCKTYIH